MVDMEMEEKIWKSTGVHVRLVPHHGQSQLSSYETPWESFGWVRIDGEYTDMILMCSWRGRDNVIDQSNKYYKKQGFN